MLARLKRFRLAPVKTIKNRGDKTLRVLEHCRNTEQDMCIEHKYGSGSILFILVIDLTNRLMHKEEASTGASLLQETMSLVWRQLLVLRGNNDNSVPFLIASICDTSQG